MSKFQRYGQAIVASAAAVLTAAYGYLTDQRITVDEWMLIILAAGGAVLTYIIPLAPQYPWAKTAVLAGIAGMEVVAVVILDGINNQEWIAIMLAVLGVLGVGAAPAVSDNGVSRRGGTSQPEPGSTLLR